MVGLLDPKNQTVSRACVLDWCISAILAHPSSGMDTVNYNHCATYAFTQLQSAILIFSGTICPLSTEIGIIWNHFTGVNSLHS